MPSISSAALAEWTSRLLGAQGFSPDRARFLSDTLVEANLRGVDSHGVIRLAAYERRVTEGLIDPAAEPLVTEQGATVQVDANGAQGQLAARTATEAVLRLARQHGVASATVRGSAHFGAAGYYARQLAEAGCIAIVVSNSEPVVVPFGGKEALLGTNPFAFAAPSKGAPISLDMATSTSAMGRVMVAQSEGKSIPDTWGVDAEGVPTTDPNQVAALLPAGGPKGYGLAFLVEVLGGVLTGAAISHGIGNMYSDFSKPQDVGHWMLAIDIATLMPLEAFTERMQGLIDLAHGSAPAPGFDSVLVPGEPEETIRAKRLAEGIHLPEATVAELAELGQRYSVAFPAVEG